jgi:hypothetical protein
LCERGGGGGDCHGLAFVTRIFYSYLSCPAGPRYAKGGKDDMS